MADEKWEPEWIYRQADFATTWQKMYDKRGYYYYFDASNPSTVTWDKPQIFTDQEKKWSEWEALLATDPIWQRKRDRFGRWMYYNRKTKKTVEEMPHTWWTWEQREVLRLHQEAEKQKALEKKAKLKAEREARISLPVKKIHAFLKLIMKNEQSPKSKEIASHPESPGVPCYGLCPVKAAVFEAALPCPIASFDARRRTVPAHVDEVDYWMGGDLAFGAGSGALLGELQVVLAEDCGKRKWPRLIPQLISLYCQQQAPLLDNLIVLPLNCCGSFFDEDYFTQLLVSEDRRLARYDQARVTAEEVGADQTREDELAAIDEMKDVCYTDEQWNGWWEEKKKDRAKKLRKMLKMRSMGYDEETGTYDFEYYDEAMDEQGSSEDEDEEYDESD